MIITFYSYKGGVGRTQLLSNLAAYLCYYENKKILLIDWDLEAPGIDYFFNFEREKISSGLIDLFIEYIKTVRNKKIDNENELPSIFGRSQQYIYNLVSTEKGKIDLLPAGDYKNDYKEKVSSFDWFDFYNTLKGKYFIEKLKKDINEADYDYVFIDSRTGTNDYSAICNVQMPDLNIFVIAPTKQNFEGSKSVMNFITNSGYVKNGMRGGYIFPILSRLDPLINNQKKQWINKFLNMFDDKLRKVNAGLELSAIKLSVEELVSRTVIEYKTDLSYGEILIFSDKMEKIIEGTIEKQYSNIAEYVENLVNQILILKKNIKSIKNEGKNDNDETNYLINILSNSEDYLKLLSEIKDLDDILKEIPDNQLDKKQKITERKQNLEKRLKEFEEQVSNLATLFTKIEINTERLRLAKAHFDKGEFREADAILKAEEISNKVAQLKQAKSKKENELAEVNKNLESKANEFLVKAQIWKTFYSEPDWFSKAQEYYEKALDASRSAAIVFEYALFLQNHNQFKKAQPLYEEALQIYRELAKENPSTYLPAVAMTLNNLANLHSAKNEFDEALGKYEEALQIRRALAQENPRTYLPDVATTLNNLAVLQKAKNEFGEALGKYQEALQIYRALAKENPSTYLPYVATTLNNLANLQQAKNELGEALANYQEALQIRRALAQENPSTYLPYVAGTLNNLANLQKAKNELGEALANYQEALQIYRALAQENPSTYLPYVATTLNNLANLHSDKNEFGEALGKYEEALQIYRTLAQENPRTYLPYVATTLNNLANLHSDKNEFGEALANYEEALQIYRVLAQENPRTYLPDVAMTVINLSIFYLQSVPDKEKSVSLAMEAVKILLPFYEQVPYLENYLNIAFQVLQANGVDLNTNARTLQVN
jgi:tetratricopeptide (TPR) repeat protein